MDTPLTSAPFLSGQVVVVTGAASGIGRVLAQHAVWVGARVGLADVDEAGLRETQGLCGGAQTALAVTADVRSEDDVRRLFDEVGRTFGRLDALVNNAGVYPTCRVVDMPTEEWDRVLDINLKGTFLCARAAARVLIRQGQGGRIVNTASASGVRGTTGKAHYCASKAGVILLTRVLALELAEHHILVNAVSPGLVETEAKQRALARDAEERRRHNVKLTQLLLGRPCAPEDVVRAVLFLLSPDSAYVTGHILHADGGATAGLRM